MEDLQRYIAETGITAVGLDWTAPLDAVQTTIQPLVAVQGALDPMRAHKALEQPAAGNRSAVVILRGAEARDAEKHILQACPAVVLDHVPGG